MKHLFSIKTLRDFVVMIIGTAIFAFAIVYLNIPNDLAEGGITGITLILRALFGINPALSTLILNIPLIFIGRKYLGVRTFYYTIVGTVALSFWLAVWQKIPIVIDLEHDILIAALLGGVITGVGSGMVYRVGGTTGGSDILARIVEKYFGISVGRSLLIFDSLVLVASLSYIDLNKMMYTLIFAYVFSRVIDSVLDGGYSAKGLLIMSEKNEEIAPKLMEELDRGITFLNGEGGFSKIDKRIIYMVLTPREISQAKEVIHEFDKNAFISVINVHEVLGEGFSYKRKKKKLFG
ncbi:YitT family protein [Enterococcus lemanii]|uniref:YitT family protein n=1 Tax=Enterococcus lemanii TaxID=1159752 RepID=A0ABV9MQN3_9ENTE|nr:YitT family protein [Enterococcus lemanii]MBM7709378.1 uncharacterized membrane-anchored protein YitT (DUF2179 family) [Enterococcus lemanii]NLM67549.1 YitT family protein [Enterococcus sp.]